MVERDGIAQLAAVLGGYDDISMLRQAQDYDRVLASAPAQPRSILDLGCGTGVLLARALSRWPQMRRVVGIDGARSRVEASRDRLGGRAVVEEGDLRRLPPRNERFDLIVMLSVSHWLYPDEEQAFAWVADHLDDEGAFLLTTHHPEPDGDGLGGEDIVVREAFDALGMNHRVLWSTVPMSVRTRSRAAVQALLTRRLICTVVDERPAPMIVESSARHQDFHAATFGTYFSRLALPTIAESTFFAALGEAAMRRMDRFGRVYDVRVTTWCCRSWRPNTGASLPP